MWINILLALSILVIAYLAIQVLNKIMTAAINITEWMIRISWYLIFSIALIGVLLNIYIIQFNPTWVNDWGTSASLVESIVATTMLLTTFSPMFFGLTSMKEVASDNQTNKITFKRVLLVIFVDLILILAILAWAIILIEIDPLTDITNWLVYQ